MNRERSTPPSESAAALAGGPQGSPVLSADDILESRIESTRQEILSAHGRSERVAAAERMRFLITLRSSHQIMKMEREHGLA